MSHTQLTEAQRYQIYTLLKNNFTQAYIAKEISVSPGTVIREIARNTGGRGYRTKQANEKELERRKTAAKFSYMTDETQKTVTDYLLQKWSPEQIAGYLKTQGGEWVSHETIYQFVLEYKKNGGELYKQLRHSVKKRKKCYGGTDRRGKIKDRIYLVIGKSHKGDL